MGSSKYKPSRMLILLTAMAVLLPLLAAIQYYWLGQVSQGATERLRGSLRDSATRFRHDFNREFIRAYLSFQMESFAPPLDIEQYHLKRLEQWRQTSPYPRLISDVFVVDYDDQVRVRLSHLNPKAKRFELSEWSGELLSLRDRFELRNEASRLNDKAANQNSLESFAEEIPALIVPFPLLPTQKSQNQAESPPWHSRSTADTPTLPPGFTIVKLDLNYMQREFIPLLIERHLFNDSNSEYNVAIVSLNHPEKVIYSSRYPVFDVALSDVSTRVFGLESDELSAFLRSDRTSSAATEVVKRPVRLINLRNRSAGGSATSSSEEDGRWQLLIKHQAGSLGAAVSSARHRNLAISFGILLLLGAGIFMTAVSTRRAERLARQQIDFVAGVTHELRTPLAVICSAGENLAHGIVDTPQKAEQYGRVIYREGRRLTDMVEQVLEFAGAQSGRPRYEFRPTNIADFVKGAVSACQAQIQERDFKIETLIAPEVPPVHGDGVALRRVMQNLISNAIKYGKDKGQHRWARITAQTCAKEEGKKEEEVRITIEDGGLGIDPADVPHIFEPFYRGHQAGATQIEGSGIGLSLVKQIVEAHGGRISVKSTPGVGSTFTLHLSIAAQAGHSKR